MNIKNTILFIGFITLTTMASISCSSSKKITMRKLDDVNKTGKTIEKKSNNEKTIAKLLDAAEYGNDEVRAEALLILADAQIPQGYELFLRYANDDPNFNVRQMSVRGIAKVPSVGSEGIEKVNVAINDTAYPVQMEALKAAATLKRDELLPNIMKSLNSSNRWIKMEAIKALKDYEGQNVNKALTSIRDSETDKDISDTANAIVEYRKTKGLI